MESSIPHTYKPAPAITWAVSTAKKMLDDFLADRAKLKRKRALTEKQQKVLSKLEMEDKRIDALIAKLEAEAAAQRSVVASFDGDVIEHFMTQ